MRLGGGRKRRESNSGELFFLIRLTQLEVDKSRETGNAKQTYGGNHWKNIREKWLKVVPMGK